MATPAFAMNEPLPLEVILEQVEFLFQHHIECMSYSCNLCKRWYVIEEAVKVGWK